MAGEELAKLLSEKKYADPVVLALPRGGVPVAIEVACVLRAPMDLVMVKKIGAPGQPELAAGAVVNGDDPQYVINTEVSRSFGLSDDDINSMASVQLEEIRRRREVYVAGRASIPVEGRTAIVVDDGICS